MDQFVIQARQERRTYVPPLRKWKASLPAWAFVLPSLVLIIGLTAYPLGFAGVVSLFDYDMVSGAAYFIGWENYTDLIGGAFIHSILVTLELAIPAVVIETILGIAVAVLLQSKPLSRMRPLIMGVVLMPLLMAPVVSGATFKLLLNPVFGVINRLFSWGTPHIDFLGNAQLALATLIAIDVWTWTPFVVLLVTAGLISVPGTLYEAAKVDGATAAQQFRYITLPMIRPVLLVVVLFRVIDIVKIADIPYTVTQGGPGSSTDFLSLLIYRTSFKTFNIGSGAAMSVVFILILMIPVLLLYRMTVKKDGAR